MSPQMILEREDANGQAGLFRVLCFSSTRNVKRWKCVCASFPSRLPARQWTKVGSGCYLLHDL